MIELTKHAQAIKAADFDVTLADSQIASDEALLETTQSDLARDNDELDRLLKLEQEDHVARVLEGEGACPRKPKRLTRIGHLRDDVEGRKAAIPLIKARIATTRHHRDNAISAKPAVILPLLRESRDQALQETRDQIAAVMPAAAKLVAHELLLQKLLGEKASVKEIHGTGPDFNALKLVEAFFEQIPLRLRPSQEELKTFPPAYQAEFRTAYDAINGETK